jgi:hypothetical protein
MGDLPQIPRPGRTQRPDRAAIGRSSAPVAARGQPSRRWHAHSVHRRAANRFQDAVARHRVRAFPRDRIAGGQQRLTAGTPGRTKAGVRLRTRSRRRGLVAELQADNALALPARECPAVVSGLGLHTPAVRNRVPAGPRTALAGRLIRLPGARIRALQRVGLGTTRHVRRPVRTILFAPVHALPGALHARRAVQVSVAHVDAIHAAGHRPACRAGIGCVVVAPIRRRSAVVSAAAVDDENRCKASRTQEHTLHARQRSTHKTRPRVSLLSTSRAVRPSIWGS